MADSSATQIQESADKLTGVLNELVANKDKMQPIITYCSDAYAQLPHTATQERDGIQAATRDYISDALLNAAYQIHCAATQFNELFNLQLDQLSQIEAKLAVANTVRAPRHCATARPPRAQPSTLSDVSMVGLLTRLPVSAAQRIRTAQEYRQASTIFGPLGTSTSSVTSQTVAGTCRQSPPPRQQRALDCQTLTGASTRAAEIPMPAKFVRGKLFDFEALDGVGTVLNPGDGTTMRAPAITVSSGSSSSASSSASGAAAFARSESGDAAAAPPPPSRSPRHSVPAPPSAPAPPSVAKSPRDAPDVGGSSATANPPPPPPVSNTGSASELFVPTTRRQPAGTMDGSAPPPAIANPEADAKRKKEEEKRKKEDEKRREEEEKRKKKDEKKDKRKSAAPASSSKRGTVLLGKPDGAAADASAAAPPPPPVLNAPPPTFNAPPPTFSAPPPVFNAPPPAFGAPPATEPAAPAFPKPVVGHFPPPVVAGSGGGSAPAAPSFPPPVTSSFPPPPPNMKFK